jgi:hypothetical protein
MGFSGDEVEISDSLHDACVDHATIESLGIIPF